MTTNISLIHDGKKFMWDGRLYPTRNEACAAGEAYRNDKFEICVIEEGQFLVYTRRVVSNVVVTTQ